MPLILVIEQEQRYVERISEALSSHGWDVKGVHDRASALQFVAGQAASVVVVNIEVPESDELITRFSRRSGGPGTVVLIPESAEDGVSELGADEVLQKPFTDQDIRLAVRRCLIGVSSVTGPKAKEAIVEETSAEKSPVERVPVEASVAEEVAEEVGRRLTSEDIFGDVVSELETALAMGTVGSMAGATAAEPEPPQPEPAAVLQEPEEVLVEEEGPVEELPVEEVVLEEVLVEEAPVREVPVGGLQLEEEAGEQAPADVGAEQGSAQAAEAGPQPEVEEHEPREEVAQPEVEVEEEAPRPDPVKTLDARIREAAEEGKRLAAAKSDQGTDAADSAASVNELLRRALLGIEQSDKPASKPEPATIEEVDELVSSVVASGQAGAPEAGEPEAGAPEAGAPEADDLEGGELEAGEPETGEPPMSQRESDERVAALGLEADALPEDEAAAILEVVEGVEQSGFRTRLKLIWAILIIALLALLAFLFARRAGDGLLPTADPVDSDLTIPATEPAEGGPGSRPGEEGSPGEGPEVGESDDPLADSEEELRRQLEAQRLQLQEEISKSQSSSDDGDGF